MQVYLGQHPLLDGGQSSCFVKGAVRSFNDLKPTDLQGALLFVADPATFLASHSVDLVLL